MWDDDEVLKIERLQNGYEVSVVDEKIVAANNKPQSKYESPWKSYAFPDVAAVVKFIEASLAALKPPPKADDVYAEAFKQASEPE